MSYLSGPTWTNHINPHAPDLLSLLPVRAATATAATFTAAATEGTPGGGTLAPREDEAMWARGAGCCGCCATASWSLPPSLSSGALRVSSAGSDGAAAAAAARAAARDCTGDCAGDGDARLAGLTSMIEVPATFPWLNILSGDLSALIGDASEKPLPPFTGDVSEVVVPDFGGGAWREGASPWSLSSPSLGSTTTLPWLNSWTGV
mmetsp:Transcript_30411/g.76100  ORF Transcript_30411/g.76100 Transcript_30411/m.76100 type:complete len:205 (-) Transcript_30411:121-735(-)|eukprot:CAMPEP_0181359260 /NCGR_PEP_ID=MMETSP1106-20121128/5983_1 /TAXON_ID=81844 /ORGANISM="Mantoniella antarctica, Strain SL-175" /LENGTH=204 /DNA_ID=CAMNT_0023472345 /DNA_START=784 /DNA_END=1398 /DNA_ORIENTATION=+